MSEYSDYDEAVQIIKTAILQSQYDAARSVNEKQLMLYYNIGKYISLNSRNGYWGKGAINTISMRLDRELPGLRGFSPRSLRDMRKFYEEWSCIEETEQTETVGLEDNLAPAGAKLEENAKMTIWHPLVPEKLTVPAEAFFSIGFTHHRIFYIKRCAEEKYSREALAKAIDRDDYHHQGQMPNNFVQTLPSGQQALRAISTFKDEYLLDYINVEELDVRDHADVDERIVENAIVNNVKNFILTFGRDFTFVRNQFHLDAFGEDQYIDLLFFSRALNCLVAVELKSGKFKPAYLGQLSSYLSVLDEFERKPHENPSIGIILCKNMNKAFVDFVIRDYTKPMGVATYKTSKDMSEELIEALPDIDDLKKLLDTEESEEE